MIHYFNQKYFRVATCFWLLGICLQPTVSSAQQKTIPLNRFYTQEIERELLRDTLSLVHTASKPLVESEVDLSNVYGFKHDTMLCYNAFCSHLYKKHFLSIKKDDYFLAIDPLFDFTIGKDFADTTSYSTSNLYVNQRGLQFIGDIGKRFSFQTSFYETQSFLPLYLKQFSDSNGIVPGFGRTKEFKVRGYDYAMSNGWVSYAPLENIHIEFGQGKNFVGHGYRSILLSDAAFCYPYLKASISFLNNRLHYTAMYASMQTLDRLPKGEVPESLFKRKGFSMNYLSWKPNSALEFGLFEGIVWERYDSAGTQPQPWGAYIPVIGVNTGINGFDSEQKIMLGANARVKINKHAFVYGQFATDNPGESQFGWQAGAKYYDLFIPNLDIQFEYNSLAGNLYTSHFPLQSYSHVNQPLGHPSGPGTQELLGILNYRYHRFTSQLKYNHITHDLGPEGAWQNDAKMTVVTFVAFPVQVIDQFDLTAGFFFNPKTNFQILVGYTSRTASTDNVLIEDQVMHTSYFYVTLRTNLINRYADF